MHYFCFFLNRWLTIRDKNHCWSIIAVMWPWIALSYTLVYDTFSTWNSHRNPAWLLFTIWLHRKRINLIQQISSGKSFTCSVVVTRFWFLIWIIFPRYHVCNAEQEYSNITQIVAVTHVLVCCILYWACIDFISTLAECAVLRKKGACSTGNLKWGCGWAYKQPGSRSLLD